MAFHPYPQLIPRFFNIGGFGPPHGLTRASSWSWVDHPVSRLPPLTRRPFRTRFRCDFGPEGLGLAREEQLVGSLSKRHAVTRRITFRLRPLCKHMVSGTISLAYKAFFSPFPHGTGSLSVMNEYLALPDGAGFFARDFSGPVLLWILAGTRRWALTGLSPSLARLSSPLQLELVSSVWRVHTPARPKPHRFGLFPFRSPLLGEFLYWSLFLRLLRCFSSPGSLRCTYVFSAG